MRGNKTAYKIRYGGFTGIDDSSDPSVVARSRIARGINVWRDYGSENGAAIETIPGFRILLREMPGVDVGGENSKINGLYLFRSRNGDNHIIIHCGEFLLRISEEGLLAGNETYGYVRDNRAAAIHVANVTSSAFTFNNLLYILDGTQIVAISDQTSELSGEVYPIGAVVADGYVPTTYYNGEPYEQRNMLSLTAVQIDKGFPAETTEVTYKDTNNVDQTVTVRRHYIFEKAVAVTSVTLHGLALFEMPSGHGYADFTSPNPYADYYIVHTDNGHVDYIDEIGTIYEPESTVEITLTLEDGTFATVNNVSNVKQGNTAYSGTFADAINNCRKCAVYDGRIFLTGNPDLPNTVFYSQRNLTGANDPTYFGVYNYFNDGDGNNMNVDMLSTPGYLMVLKGNSSNEGTIYYHTAAYNEDDATKDLIPRIYPATQGASGLGSAANKDSHNLACNFLDDAVFLSRRGLDAIGKATLNLERTVTHRSSNVDRAMRNVDLSAASMAEWLGYLVVSAGGKMFLADSRVMRQHEDGSYQYEWFMLDGIGTYETYSDAYRTVAQFPYIDGVSLGDYERVAGEKLSDFVSVYGSEILVTDEQYTVTVSYDGDSREIRYITRDGVNYLVDVAYGMKNGVGDFKAPSAILVVGDRLYFATDHGDLCVFNTDKRGVAINGFSYGDDKFHAQFYSFAGVPYRSEIALRRDDCDKISTQKSTVISSAVARLKAMPNGRCECLVSLDGMPFTKSSDIYCNIFSDFSDVNFGNAALGDDGELYVNITDDFRGWCSKQYWFRSYTAFGLYGLEYQYYENGIVRERLSYPASSYDYIWGDISIPTEGNTSGSSESGGVYWCNYGTTLLAEVVVAIRDNKLPVCEYLAPNSTTYEYYIFRAKSALNDSEIQFQAAGGTSRMVLNASGWSIIPGASYESTSNKVNDIEANKQSTTYYPTVKAVSDEIKRQISNVKLYVEDKGYLTIANLPIWGGGYSNVN